MVETTMDEKVSIIEKITDNIISVLSTIGILSMALFQIPIPEFLIGAWMLILGFYFKNK